MKHPLAIAVILAGIVLPLPLQAQFRSAPHAFASRPMAMAPARMSSVRMSSGVSRMRPAPNRPRRGVPATAGLDLSGQQTTPFGNTPNLPPGYFAGMPCLTNPSYSGSFYCSQFLPHHRGSFGAAAFVPFYWSPPMDYSTAEETSMPTPAPQEDTTLAKKVDALTDQVQMLRDEQIERELSVPVATTTQPTVQEKTVSTLLVYRDGRQSEVQNYAILGKTLWVFAGQTTRKVPLADLDLDVTRKLNEDRGIEFVAEGSI